MARKKSPITFQDRTFCFTGKMAEMRRKDAEREVRARGGMSQSGVNRTLDYLVIGDIPSHGWAHGDYGTKIQKALDFKAAGKRKPRIVSESEFFENLTATPPNNSGEINSKIISCTYRVFLDHTHVLEEMGFWEMSDRLQAAGDCHVKIKVFESASVAILFSEDGITSETEGWDVVVRVAKVAGLDFDKEPLVAAIKAILAEWFEDEGHLSVVERKEGSTSFANYLKQLPKADRVQYLTTDR